MLRDPESVIGDLEIQLRECRGEGGAGESALFVEMEELRAEAGRKEGERNSLYRLLRKGMLPETGLKSQLDELREEETALASRLE